MEQRLQAIRPLVRTWYLDRPIRALRFRLGYGKHHDRRHRRSSALQPWGKRVDPQDEALGRSKGGFTTKIYAVVGGLARKVPFRPRHALGNPLRLLLTAGNRHDVIPSCPEEVLPLQGRAERAN